MKKRSAHSLGGRRDSSVQRNVDELASRRAVLGQVELPLQLHFAVRGIRSSGLRLCTENCSESQRRCSHRNETSSEDVATTGLCERLDAELWGGQRHDGVYTPVGKSGRRQREVAHVALEASESGPTWLKPVAGVALLDVPPARNVDRHDWLGRLLELVENGDEGRPGGRLEREACSARSVSDRFGSSSEPLTRKPDLTEHAIEDDVRVLNGPPEGHILCVRSHREARGGRRRWRNQRQVEVFTLLLQALC